jgi:hypothetical protein
MCKSLYGPSALIFRARRAVVLFHEIVPGRKSALNITKGGQPSSLGYGIKPAEKLIHIAPINLALIN